MIDLRVIKDAVNQVVIMMERSHQIGGERSQMQEVEGAKLSSSELISGMPG